MSVRRDDLPFDLLAPYASAPSVGPIAAFWLAWTLAVVLWGRGPWLALTAQLWVAYAVVGLALWTLRRRVDVQALTWRRVLPVAFTAACAGAAVALPLAHDFVPSRLFAIDWWLRRGLLPLGFALALHLPALVVRLRESRRQADRVRQALQASALAELSRQVTVAELKTLQAQVEPHFLYNTLASLQYLVKHDPPLAETMLRHLHDYLRLALPAMRAPESTVGRELALASAYLAIMKLRLGERFEYEVRVPDELTALPFPPMMVATLVENAVKHGIEPQVGIGRVQVCAERDEAGLEIRVVDNGAGLQPAAPTRGQGVGLANLRERLVSLYGGAATMSIASAGDAGVAAIIRIPCP